MNLVLLSPHLRRCVSIGAIMGTLMSHLAGVASAQTPHITLDGSLASRGGSAFREFTELNVSITESMGVRTGPNLLHSFGRLNVPTGGSLTFTGDTAGISRVIGRVTGIGEVSSIDGPVNLNIAGADLYLINPSGMVFGPNARLNVSGSVGLSTGDYMKFTDGTQIHADVARPFEVTMAPLDTFGFLDRAQYAALTIDRGALKVPTGKTIAVVGGNLNLTGVSLSSPPALQALSGRVELVSVASAGEVAAVRAVGAAAPALDAFAALGAIALDSKASVVASADTVSGTPGGQVVIRGGRLTVDNSSSVLASTAGNGNAPAVALDIAVRDALLVDHSSVLSAPNNLAVFTTGSGHAGAIELSAATLDVTNSASLFANYSTNGNGADLRIRVGSFRLTGGATVELRNLGSGNTGNGGTIDIQATHDMLIGSRSTIKTENFRGQGAGSPILITTPQLIIEGGTSAGQAAGITAITGGNGPASSVVLSVGTLELRGGQASIDTRARDVSVTPTAPPQFGGGPIAVQGVGGTGTAAELVSLSGRLSGFLTETEGNGAGGRLDITTNRLVLIDQARISANTLGSGQAGTIALNVNLLDVQGGGRLDSSTSSTSTNPKGGSGGMIAVRGVTGEGSVADMVMVSGQDPFGGVSRFLTETRGTGDGGTLHVQAVQVILSDGALVSATTSRTGAAGAIMMDVESLTLRRQAAITSSSTSQAVTAGNGGNVTLLAGQTLALLEQSRVTATSAGGQLLLQNGQLISAGNAGVLTLTAGDSLILNNSTITTTATMADGGDIKLTASNLILLNNSRVESSVGGGALTTGGNINIDPQAVVLNNSQVLANAFQGTGGNIVIAGNVVLVDPASIIDASSQQGVSGQVLIQAPVSNLAAALSRLTQKPLNAIELLTARCAARLREGQVSSLTVVGRDGVPPEPGRYSPGSLMADLARVAAASPRSQPAPGTQYRRIGGDTTNPSAALLIQGPFGSCKG